MGHSWRPIRATVSASSVTALSAWSMEPWPAVPARGQAHPGHALFRGLQQVEALAADGRAEPADLADRLGDALEEVAGGCPPASGRRSCRRPPRRRGRRARRRGAGGGPRAVRWRTTASIIASMSFMSTAPRPQTQPSAISPENGCTCQSAASAGTTSRWPWMSRAGRAGSVPSSRATTLARVGCGLEHCGSRPTSASSAATCSAAARSPGPEWSPGLVVSILIRSLQRAATSSCAVGVAAAWSACSVTWYRRIRPSSAGRRVGWSGDRLRPDRPGLLS